jgi:DNA-binding transcriptional MerR regulator
VAGIRGDGAGPGAASSAGAASRARQPSASRRGLRPAEQLQFLFDGDPAPQPEDLGYRGPTACAAAGITYRQLDYWARTGLVEPSVRSASGSGTQRLYGFRDILVLKVVKRLLDLGISLQQIRQAVGYLRDRGSTDLAQVTLMSDGVSVYEFTSQDDVIDLLQGGQGVFGIALNHVWREVEGKLATLPAERTGSDSGPGSGSASGAASGSGSGSGFGSGSGPDDKAADEPADASASGGSAPGGSASGGSASGGSASGASAPGGSAAGLHADELARRRVRRTG